MQQKGGYSKMKSPGMKSPDMKSPAMKPKGNVFAILKRLTVYLTDYKGSIVLVVIGFIFSTALGLTPAWLVKIALDRFLLPEKSAYLWYIAAAMVGAGILQGGIDFVTRYAAESMGQKVVYTIRQKVYRHLMELSFSYFDKARTGDIMSRLTADAETLQSFFGFACVHIISNSLFIIGILVVMFFWSVKLALLYIIILPFIVFGISRYAFRVRPAYGKSRRVLGKLTGYIQEQLQGIQITKIFGREKQAVKSFEQMNNQLLKINLDAGRITSFWMPYVFVLIGLSTGVTLWYGGIQVIGEGITLGTLVGFTTYIGMMMRPVRQTGMLVSRVMVSAASAERIFEVLDTQPEVKDEPGAESISKIKGGVSYENVSFSYDKNTPVLQNISFEVKPGETVAVVGPTGAGKTTLVHLLPRFYDVDSGEIKIDGRPIKDFTIASLRQNIGIVLQHTFLFNISIKDNISFGKPEADMKEIRNAARAAEIDDYIMSLPQKYNTVTGERGVRLSGGQRQRISIARTILMDPGLLILDEPTSSVDSETDEKIQKALDNLCKNRTVFMIAHRLWTLKNADRILVIDNGQMMQYGSHSELIEKTGLYKDIYTLQVDGEKYGIINGKSTNEQEDE
jgi:ATP-binding cassette, subfamily B, multidrug efflux pump